MSKNVPVKKAPEMISAVTPTPEISPATAYLLRLSPSSRRVAAQSLNALHDLLMAPQDSPSDLRRFQRVPWHQLRQGDTQRVRAALQEAVSRKTGAALAVATVNRYLVALRGVLRECYRRGLIVSDDYQRAIDFTPVRGNSMPAGCALTQRELTALFQTCRHNGKQLSGVRDAAMLAVLYGGGLRRAEVAALRVEDYEAGALRVRRGKGRKARVVWLGGEARHCLESWLATSCLESGALFRGINRWGQVNVSGITPQTVFDVVRRRAQDAGLKSVTPHDLRRTFVSNLLDLGVDIATVQRMAGHADVSTTVRYDRRGERAAHAAAEKLKFGSQNSN